MRQDEEVDKIFFTSDLHLLHPKIVKLCNRPISEKDHDEWLIHRINEKISKYDELYILGDVSMGNKYSTEILLDKINGKKHLILGNHDNSIRNSTRFKSVSHIKNFTFNSPSFSNIHIVLCHYPLRSWERSVHGSGHLFGHVHGRLVPYYNSFDIGVDANGYQVLSLREVLEKFKTLKEKNGTIRV